MEPYILVKVGAMFTILAVVGLVASKLKQSVIPFYLLAGIVFGPNVLGRSDFPHIPNTEFIEVGAELGVIFLLFFLGMEFNLDRLIEARHKIGKAGTLDLVVNFGIGFLIGFLLFGDLLVALLVAGVVYISSSAIITKSLIDLGWIANDEAEPILGTLIYEDVFIAVYLAMISALLFGGGGWIPAFKSIGIATAFLLLLLLLVYFGTRYFQKMIKTDSNEAMALRIIGTTVLIGGAGLALGVSHAVAGFFVGMAFSTTDYVEDIEKMFEPFRDVFAAVFFFWIGILTDPFFFLGMSPVILVLVLFTTPTKLITGYLSGKFYGLGKVRSLRVGIGMTTRGEFSLIIASLALAGAGQGVAEGIAGDLYASTVGYVLVMSILGTTLMEHSSIFEQFLKT